MSIIFVIWAIIKVVDDDLHKIDEPSSSTSKKLVQFEFVFLFLMAATILIMYATFYTSKLDYSVSIRIIMYIFWFYLLVRCFSIEEKFSKQLILLGIIFMLLFEAVFCDVLNSERSKKKYSSIQEMELDLGDTFLLPTETWDIYPRDKMSGYRYEAYYNRLPPFPLINYKSVDTNIKTCVLTKGASDGVSKYISLKVIIRLSDEPHEKLYNTDIETMSVCSDSKNNPYYFEEIEYRTRIAFEYQDYLYVIVVDTEQSEHNASSIAYEMYYDMRYGGVACNTNNKCIYTSD